MVHGSWVKAIWILRLLILSIRALVAVSLRWRYIWVTSTIGTPVSGFLGSRWWYLRLSHVLMAAPDSLGFSSWASPLLPFQFWQGFPWVNSQTRPPVKDLPFIHVYSFILMAKYVEYALHREHAAPTFYKYCECPPSSLVSTSRRPRERGYHSRAPSGCWWRPIFSL